MGSTFVGRQAEFSELAAAVDEAVEGQGRGFLVLGEAGIGKTRLASELADHARSLGVLVLWGRCWEAGGAPSYWPWTEALRGVGADLPAASTDRFEFFDAVGSLLRQLATAHPVLVVLDDLHAADVPSLLLLEYLLGGALRQARTALVALARDHEFDGAEAMRIRRLARPVRLRGLTHDEVAELVEHRTSTRPPDDVVDAVAEATEGNPLFVEELAALLARGGGSLTPLPVGIRATIRERVAPLPDDSLDALSVGAVMGREFDVDVIGVPASAIDAAVRSGLVAEAGAGRFRFAHILIRDVLYDELAPSDRARLHRAIADALDARGDVEPDELAHHYVAAGDDRAVAALLRAGAHAEDRLAHERAVVHYERALALGAPETRADVLLALGRAYDCTGQTQQAKQAFTEAADLARKRDDPERLALAALGLTERVAFQQHDDSGVAVLEEALAGLPADAAVLRARLLSALARVLGYVGRRDRMEETARLAIDAARAVDEPEILASALLARQLTLWGPDHVADRLDVAAELLALAERTGDRRLALDAHMSRMICQLETGDAREFDRSLAAYERLADELRQPHFRFLGLVRKAMRALMQGDLETGARLADEARRLGTACNEPDAEPVYHGLWALPARETDRVDLAEVERFFLEFSNRHTSAGSRALLAMFAMERGDVGAARRDLDVLLAGVETLPKDMDWLLCLALSAEVAARLGDTAAAAVLYPLLAPYEDRCALVAGAVCFAGSIAHYLGLLAATLSRAEDAQRHFAVAARVHADMGAAPWSARTGRAAGAGSATGTVVLRCEGATWLVRRGTSEFRLADAKGLHHLARLLACPGRELHVLDLVGGGVVGGDAGPVLDGAAKAAYRRRVDELRAEIDEAEQWGDGERAARAQAELDAVAHELSAAVGLGGRGRGATASTADRARVSVRKAIVRAVAEIDKHDPDLGRYLSTTVRTGVFCAYEPDPRFGLTWEL